MYLSHDIQGRTAFLRKRTQYEEIHYYYMFQMFLVDIITKLLSRCVLTQTNTVRVLMQTDMWKLEEIQIPQ